MTYLTCFAFEKKVMKTGSELKIRWGGGGGGEGIVEQRKAEFSEQTKPCMLE